MNGEVKRVETQEALQLKHQESFRDNYLTPAIVNGLVEMTIPNKPNSSKQRYLLTIKGLILRDQLKIAGLKKT